MLEKLEQLANFLLEVPNEHFDYGVYCGGIGGGSMSGHSFAEALHNCGTKGCAIGWAVALWPNDWTIQDNYPRLLGGTGGSLADAATFFEISANASIHLFLPDVGEWEASAQDVAKKIHKFIREVRATGDFSLGSTME